MDQLGLSVIYKYLKLVNLPLIPNYLVKDEKERKDFKFDWLKCEADLKKTFYMDVFIGFIVQANIYNRSENVLYLGTRGLQCPLPRYEKFKLYTSIIYVHFLVQFEKILRKIR